MTAPARDIPALNVVGAGKVGKTLARLWQQAGCFVVQDVLNSSVSSASTATEFIGAGRAVAQAVELRPAAVWMLATGDDQIERSCELLVSTGKIERGNMLFHCSGALSSAVLHSAHAAGALVASMHPVRSFADAARASKEFHGTWCGIEGDGPVAGMLTRACEAISAKPFMIDGAQKVLYHAAAVFASNYLVTLLDTAFRAYEAAGVRKDVARQVLEPLVRGTMDNVFRLDPAAALTGPIARGDLATAHRQQDAVAAWEADSGVLYEAFIALTRELAERK